MTLSSASGVRLHLSFDAGQGTPSAATAVHTPARACMHAMRIGAFTDMAWIFGYVPVPKRREGEGSRLRALFNGDPGRSAAIQSPTRYFAAPTPGSKTGPGRSRWPHTPRRLRRGDLERSTPIHTDSEPNRLVRGPQHPPTPLPNPGSCLRFEKGPPGRSRRAPARWRGDPGRSTPIQGRPGGPEGGSLCGGARKKRGAPHRDTAPTSPPPGHHSASLLHLSPTPCRPSPPLPCPPPLRRPQPPVVSSPGPPLEPPGPGQDTTTRLGPTLLSALEGM